MYRLPDHPVIEKLEREGWPLEPFDFAEVKIKTDGTISKVFINGEDFSGATSVKFEHKAGGIPTLTVTLAVESLNVDGNAQFKKKTCTVNNGTGTRTIGSPLIRK